MKIPAHFFPESGLVLDELLDPMREETVGSVMTETDLSETPAKLELALMLVLNCEFISDYLQTHLLTLLLSMQAIPAKS